LRKRLPTFLKVNTIKNTLCKVGNLNLIPLILYFMIIAVNISFTATGFFTNDFIVNCFSRSALQYPQHQFIYIVADGFNEKYTASKNSTVVSIGAAAKNPLRLQYQLNYKIPAILRKHKVDVCISSGGVCSLRSKVPQCMFVNDLSFFHHPELYTKSWWRFYKKNTTKFLDKAKAVITPAEFIKNEIGTQYKTAAEKIIVAHYGTGENYTPLSWQEKEAIKETYTEGREYFLYSGPVHLQQNLFTLLKAFSFFKKRQKSNMQLVMASKNAVNNDFITNLATYKYRKEVKVLDNLPAESLAKITGAAYALVYPSGYHILGSSITEAMQSDIPIITTNTPDAKEICGDAALYINPKDFNDIADKIMLLFKDENKRNELIANGSQQAARYNWATTAGLVWQVVAKCAG